MPKCCSGGARALGFPTAHPCLSFPTCGGCLYPTMGYKDTQGCSGTVTPGFIPLGAGVFWRGAGPHRMVLGDTGRRWGGRCTPAPLQDLQTCCHQRVGVLKPMPWLSLMGGLELGFVTAEPCLCPGRGHGQVRGMGTHRREAWTPRVPQPQPHLRWLQVLCLPAVASLHPSPALAPTPLPAPSPHSHPAVQRPHGGCHLHRDIPADGVKPPSCSRQGQILLPRALLPTQRVVPRLAILKGQRIAAGWPRIRPSPCHRGRSGAVPLLC